MNEDLAGSKFVKKQPSFERRLAAAVILQAKDDFMQFEKARPAKVSRLTKSQDKARRADIESAENFFRNDRNATYGFLGAPMYRFWRAVLRPFVNEADVFDVTIRPRLDDIKKAKFDAAMIQVGLPVGSQYAKEVWVEAYRRIVEIGWYPFYVRQTGDIPRSRGRVTKLQREFWQDTFRASLKPVDVEAECVDIEFERANGLREAA